MRSRVVALFVVLITLLPAWAQPAATQPRADEPRVFLLRPELLAYSKRGVRAGNPELHPAFMLLMRQAKAALKAGPYSVTQKNQMPPSGDKHDYMSLGSYWWPDPDKPDGLPYIRRDGERNPEGDKLDGPKLSAMNSAVNTLALAYHLSNNAMYADHAAKLLRVWFLDEATRMNPHLEFGQGIPGRMSGRGIGIIDTAKLIHLVDSIGLLERSAALTEDDVAGLKAWFHAYLTWMLESEKGRDEARQPNNHGTYYDAQVAAFGLFVGDKEIARRALSARPKERIAAQIEPDGRQPWELRRTKSFGYSTMNLRGFLDVARLGEHVGLDLWTYEAPDGRSIRKAIDFLAPYAAPEREWTYQQITPLKRSALFEMLRRAAIRFEDERYEKLIERLPRQDIRESRLQLTYPRRADVPSP